MLRVFLFASLFATIAVAQPAERVDVFVSNSAYQTAGRYGQEVFGNFRFIVLRGGVEVPIIRRQGLTGRIGLAVDVARYQTAPGSLLDLDSKVQIRFLDLYARVDAGALSATLGGQVSLSCDANSGDPLIDYNRRIFVGDCQGALWGRLDGKQPLRERLRLTGGVSGAFTLPITIEDARVNRADVFVARAGIEGDASSGVTFGIRLIGTYRTEPRVNGGGIMPSDDQPLDPSSYLLSAAPYLEVAPQNWKVAFGLALEAPGVAGNEHLRYGITITGENDFKVRLPVTWSVRVGI